MSDLNKLSKDIYLANVNKGFYEDNANLIEHLVNTGASKLMIETAKKAVTGQRLALIHSEISEALEGNRKDKYFKADGYFKDIMLADLNNETFKIAFENCVKDTEEDEMADALIRILDFCGANNIDIDFHVSQKLRYNSLRPHKHGKTY